MIPYHKWSFSLLLIAPFAWGETQVGPTHGPFTWYDSGCGQQIEVTIKVFKDISGFPGLYRWDYNIRNISVSLDYCGSAGGDLGLGYFDLYFPQEIPDLANISLPEGWAHVTGSWGVNGRASSMLKVGTNIGGLPVGEVLHLSFTTLPRQPVSLNACQWSDESWPDAPCGQALGLAYPCRPAPNGSLLPSENRAMPLSACRHEASDNLRTTFCQALSGSGVVPGPGDPKVQISRISFAGISLRIDSSTPVVQGPHWVSQTKDKAPSWQPYDAETSAPAGF